jgi:hypothetical protein
MVTSLPVFGPQDDSKRGVFFLRFDVQGTEVLRTPFDFKGREAISVFFSFGKSMRGTITKNKSGLSRSLYSSPLS